MPDWFIKVLPWAISGLLVLGVAWGVLKTTVSSLKSAFEAEQKLNSEVNKKLFEKVDDIYRLMTDSTAELRQMRENDKAAQERRNSSFDNRMTAIDERNNLIASSNQKLTETVELMTNRMESLTSAVLDDIGKKPS